MSEILFQAVLCLLDFSLCNALPATELCSAVPEISHERSVCTMEMKKVENFYHTLHFQFPHLFEFFLIWVPRLFSLLSTLAL